ncbi:MAG: MBL fold metallo-hydrolase [Lachnospiraceae bacterium]|nr:MBL fold metallo-hydrolase [Lachnospiraceae bacterium]
MAEIKIGRMVLGVCQTNCYFVYREGSKEVIFFDPADKGEQIQEALEKNGFQIKAIFLTHGHFDHIWGCEGICKAAEEKGREQVKIYACEAEKDLLLDAHKNVSKQMSRPYTLEADVYVQDGQILEVAGMTCQVIATPGHTGGGCCYYFEDAGLLVSGDTLFLESVGRTDLPTGSMSTLVRSIKEKLFVLPEETVVYPGHGDRTTIGHEKNYNPFLG